MTTSGGRYPGIAIVDATERNPSDGWYAWRIVGGTIHYLQRDGSWKKDCTHGWFGAQADIEKLLNAEFGPDGAGDTAGGISKI